MFRDGNNQAMQLVMQGYSDSIRAKTSNQGTAMANAFGQGLSNAVQTHDNHEQAMQNREATRLQNEYMNRTMDDRVKHQAQQTKANDLANEYTERTLDDRVAHEEQRTLMNGLDIEGKWLNNNLQAMKNDTFKRTQESDIGATNAINYANAMRANLNRELDGIELGRYTKKHSVREVNGKYQKLVYRKDKDTGETHADWEDIDKQTFDNYMEHNKDIEYNRHTYGKSRTSANEAVLTNNQAQAAQNVVAREMGNANHAAIKETQKLFTEQNYTPNEIAGLINESERNQQSYITLSGGEKVDLLFAKQAIGYGLGGANGGGIGGGVSINNKNDMTFREQVADAVKIFRDPNATEEQKEKARATLATEKDIKELYKKVGGYALAAEQMQQIAGQDRLNTFIGFLGQYVGGDNAKQYGELSAAQSNILTSLGTSALKGTLSNMDMNIIRKQVSDLRKSGAFNEGVLVSALNKMIKDIEYSTENFGGVQILTPMAQAQYNSFVKLRQALIER